MNLLKIVKHFLFKHRFVAFSILIGLLMTALILIFIMQVRVPFQNKTAKIELSHEQTEWIRQNPIVTVGVDLDFAPIEYVDENGRYVGVTADFLSLMEKKTGLQFRIDQDYSWEESIARIKAGEIHMLGAAVPSDQRRKHMDFTEPYAWLSGVIIVRKDVTEPMSLEKLKDMKVAVVYNYIWRDILEASYPELDISPAPNIEAALKKVSFGMVDAMVGFMGTASHHIERLGISNLKISGETVSVLDISFAVNKETPHLKDILNRALEQTSDEQRRSIIRKWISLELNKSLKLKWVTRFIFPGIGVVLLVLVGIIIWNRSLQRQVIQRTRKLNQELVQRKTMEEALRDSEEKYRSIFNNIQDVYYEVNPQGMVLEISPSLEKTFGYERRDVLNSQLSMIFVNPAECKDMLANVIREERLADYETLLIHRNSEKLNCSMNAMSIKNSRNETVKVIGSIRNITERVQAQKELKTAYHELELRVRERTAELRHANEALNRAKEAADAATKAKSDFLANMSHEIRTPLSGVISASELVMHESPPKKIARYINIIRTSGQALLSVIDDILDFSKIEAGKLDIEVHPFHLDQIIGRTVSLFKHKMKEKKISFAVEVDPDIPRYLVGDSFRIQQVLTNLLSNAVKFTDGGGTISLKVSAHSQPADSEPVLISFAVEDTGIGIRAEHQDLLFTPFSQVDASTTRKYGGSGLGLSICGQLVDMMNGTIRVESRPGEGSRFVFTIPLDVCQEPDRTDEECYSPHEQVSAMSAYRELLNGKKVLVVEDTPTNQEIVLALLELAGIETRLVDTGVKAVSVLAKETFDAVLMDIQMPEMDGFEATRAIRELDGKDRLPIIAMTAHTFKEDQDKCMEAGMNGYISKPLNQEKLFKTLIEHIQKKRHASDPRNDAAGFVTEPEDGPKSERLSFLPKQVPGINLEKARAALGVDEKVFFNILQTFYNNHLNIIDRIERAWEKKERDAVITLVHSIKGSAAGIGAQDLYAIAFDIESLCRGAEILPLAKDAGLPALEKEMDVVTASIGALASLDPSNEKETLRVKQDPETAIALLNRLEQVLAFPEIQEIDEIMEALGTVSNHPALLTLKEYIDSYDHELARECVVKIKSELEENMS